METVPESKEHPKSARSKSSPTRSASLRTRDGIAIPDDLIAERARNAVAALEGEFDLVPKAQRVGVYTGAANLVVAMVSKYLAIRREVQEVSGRLDAMTMTDAAVAVAALLADPFDRDARTEARLWLKAWQTTQTARSSTSTTERAAVGS